MADNLEVHLEGRIDAEVVKLVMIMTLLKQGITVRQDRRSIHQILEHVDPEGVRRPRKQRGDLTIVALAGTQKRRTDLV